MLEQRQLLLLNSALPHFSMKRFILSVPCLLLLSACGNTAQVGTTTQSLLENPLFAERYGEEIVQALVELQIQESPLLENEEVTALVDEQRREWLKISKQARKDQRDGAMLGNFISIDEYTKGEVLYAKDALHFGTQFTTTPAIDLQVYLSQATDPRDIEFPDDTALSLGTLQTPYGAQSYSVPPQSDPSLYRTAVLWDAGLERIQGFAQLSPQ